MVFCKKLSFKVNYYMTKESSLNLSGKKVSLFCLTPREQWQRTLLSQWIPKTQSQSWLHARIIQKAFQKDRFFGSDGSEPLEEASLKSLKHIKTDYQWIDSRRGEVFLALSAPKEKENGDNLGIGGSAEICLSTLLAWNRSCQTLDERPGSVAQWASMVLSAVEHVQWHRPFKSSRRSLEATVYLRSMLGFPRWC